MQTFSALQVQAHFGQRYPNVAHPIIMDTDYDAVDAEFIRKCYKSFLRWLKLMGLVYWNINKLDCDKYSWLFRGYCIAVYARKKEARNNIPLSLTNYNLEGVSGAGHSICSFLEPSGHILEIYPAPAKVQGGFLTLSRREQASAFVYIL